MLWTETAALRVCSRARHYSGVLTPTEGRLLIQGQICVWVQVGEWTLQSCDGCWFDHLLHHEFKHYSWRGCGTFGIILCHPCLGVSVSTEEKTGSEHRWLQKRYKTTNAAHLAFVFCVLALRSTGALFWSIRTAPWVLCMQQSKSPTADGSWHSLRSGGV